MKVGTQMATTGRPRNSLSDIAKSQSEQKDFSTAILGATLQNQIVKSVPDERSRARFTSMIISTVNQSTELQQCSPSSIVAAALRGEGMGLQIGLHFYVVPYAGTASFILGYKGMIALALNTNQYKFLDAMDVREGEYCGRDPQTGQPIFNMNIYGTDDEERESHQIIGYKANFILRNGTERTEYWTVEKIVKHAVKYSHIDYDKITGIINGEIIRDKGKKESPWYDFPEGFDIMAKKTVMRSLLNSGYAPITNELRYILDTDNDYVIPDNAQNTAPPDPLRNVIETTATVKDVPTTQKPSQANVEPPQSAPKAEAKETPTAKQKSATTQRQAAQKAPANDPLRGNMNTPIERAEAEEVPFDEAASGQASMFDMLGR